MSEANGVEAAGGADDRGDLLDLALTLAAHARLIAVATLLAGGLALGVAFWMTPIFTATTVILTPQKSDSLASALLGSLGGLGGAAGALVGIKSSSDQWVGMLKSDTIANALVDQFHLLERYDVEYRFQARNALAGVTSIKAGKDTLITISVDDKDPKVAAALAAGYVSELQNLSKSVAMTEAGQRRLFFEQQLHDASKNLESSSNALQRGGIGQDIVKTDPGTAIEIVARLRAQITASEVRASVMRGYMTENNPDLRLANAELESLRRQLANADQVDQGGVPPAGKEYVSRYRDFKYYETLFQLMAKQYEIAKIDEAQEGAVVQVVDRAEVPEWKSKPKRGLIAVAAALLAFVGVSTFVLIRQSLRDMNRRDPVAAAKLHKLRRMRLWGSSRS